MIRIPVEYSIVKALSGPQLTRNVEAAFADGFEPAGGLVVTQDNDGLPIFLQAVVKYEGVTPQQYELRMAK